MGYPPFWSIVDLRDQINIAFVIITFAFEKPSALFAMTHVTCTYLAFRLPKTCFVNVLGHILKGNLSNEWSNTLRNANSKAYVTKRVTKNEYAFTHHRRALNFLVVVWLLRREQTGGFSLLFAKLVNIIAGTRMSIWSRIFRDDNRVRPGNWICEHLTSACNTRSEAVAEASSFS